MNCKYSGPGIYKFEGPASTKVLICDRITDDAHLRVRSEHLEIIVILSGTETTCDLITDDRKDPDYVFDIYSETDESKHDDCDVFTITQEQINI